MFQPVDAFLERIPKPFLIALVITLVMVTGGINLLSAPDEHFMLLYLLPIALTSWYVS